jgi:hypothetical protein
MMNVFAFQFDIEPAAGQTGFACLAAVRELITEWVRGIYRQMKNESPPFPFDGSVVKPHAFHEVRTDARQCDTHGLVTLEWEFPAGGDPSVAWRWLAVVACDAGAVQAAFRTDAASRSPAVRPMQYTIDTGHTILLAYPALHRRLTATWRCRTGGQPVTANPRDVTEDHAEAFVEELLSPARALPVFALNLTGAVKIEAPSLQLIQDRLLGLGQLAVVQDAAANSRLTELLGPDLALGEGVLRTYWPGLTKESPPEDHALRSAEEVLEGVKSEPLELRLLRMTSVIACARFREGPLITAARAALDRDQAGKKQVVEAAAEAARRHRKETEAADANLRRSREQCDGFRRDRDTARRDCEAAREQVKALESERAQTRARISELEEELRKASESELLVALERAWDENKEMQDACERERRRADAVAEELRLLRENWNQMWARPPEPEEPAAPDRRHEETADGDWDFESVADALDVAEMEFGDVLTIWDNASRSAEDSPFSSPGKVFRALKAIAEVGRAYFRSQDGGTPLGPVEQAFASRVPFKYTAFESQMTMNLYGEERTFRHGTQSRQMQRHLTLGGGTTNNCLQIYFEFDDAARRVLVGYCGRHLKYYRQRT